jgi:hypothetical protein
MVNDEIEYLIGRGYNGKAVDRMCEHPELTFSPLEERTLDEDAQILREQRRLERIHAQNEGYVPKRYRR